MKDKQFIGIDVSKIVLDVFILTLKFHFQVDNNPNGFAKLLEMICTKLSCKKDDLFFLFENTGRYSRLLSVFMDSNNISFAMLNALDVKQSKGLTRGKSDKMDARSIALYSWRKRDELQPTILHSAEVGQLRQLLSLRDKLIRQRTAHKNGICDLQDCFVEGETEFIRSIQSEMIETLDKQVQRVEEEIEKIIDQMPDWSANYKLIQTVRGIGHVLAKYLIIFTENFTRFPDSRKFACYAGIAPFEYTSGSSIRGKVKVNKCANKQLKSLLNMAAMSAIQFKGEYKTYYHRRINEGKNKMSTLNIIRNKLVYRVFAVVKRQTPYVDIYRFAA